MHAAEVIKAIASLVTAIAWPAVVGIVLWLLRAPLVQVLGRAKRVAFKFLEHEIVIEGDQVVPEVQELLREVDQMLSGLTDEHRSMFQKIQASDGRKTVKELMPKFERDSAEHRLLQELRDRKLVRPSEGGSWKEDKHPVATRFSALVQRINPRYLQPALPGA